MFGKEGAEGVGSTIVYSSNRWDHLTEAYLEPLKEVKITYLEKILWITEFMRSRIAY
jgi:hypothetical protein